MADGKRCYPDGLIRVTRGSYSWTCLVEVKTGTNDLEVPQLETYLDVARDEGFDALLTISNQIPAIAGQHPTKVDKRKLKRVAIHHLSWSQVLAEAVMQKEHRGVADPDQAWILGELIRYLEHPRSGALEFDDMGPSWVPVRDAVAAGTLRANDKLAPEVASRFDALLRFASLRLGRQLGTDVTPLLSRRELQEPALRVQALVTSLVSNGTMTGVIRIPGTVGPLNVVVDLRAGKVTCFVDVEAPKQGKALTRVNWIVRQLKSAPEHVRLEAATAFSRGITTAELLRDVRVDPAKLISDPTKDVRSFRVAMTAPLGPKRGRGRGGAIDSVLDAVDAFYGEVLGSLKVWTATPPRLREEPAALIEVEPELVSTSLSSQDGPVATVATELPVIVQTVSSTQAVSTADIDETPPGWLHVDGSETGDETLA
ncbi:MAG: stress response protein [Frankiales bacterium]|nr:stress response protein [Frankiales bacterium]